MRNRVAEGSLVAGKLLPYMTHLITSMSPVERPGIGTMGVDTRARMYYDPEFVRSHELIELAFVISHEALHVFLNHPKRFLAKFPQAKQLEVPGTLSRKESHFLMRMLKLWNVAADLAINGMLIKSMARLKEGCYAEDFGFAEGLTADEYFELLLQKRGKEKEPGKGEDEGEEEGEGGGEGQDEGEGEGEGQDEGKGGDEEWTGIGGSGADGVKRPWEGSRDGGLPEHDQECVRRGTARKIEEYKASRGKGSIPEGLVRAASDMLRPRVNPIQAIKSRIQSTIAHVPGFGDLTYNKPKRRKLPGNVLMPASIRPLARVLVIVDTSGSMEDTDLRLGLGVIHDVLRGLPDPSGVPVWAGDAALQTAQNVFSTNQVELKGGGGTDMGGLIEQAAASRPTPSAIIVVTDGYTGWPSRKTRMPVIVCLTQSSMKDSVPSWMRTLCISPEDEG